MNRLNKLGRACLIFCLLSVAVALGGCEGSDTRQKTDDTVKEMTGKKDVEKYKQMKEDLNKIQQKQGERNRQLDVDP